MHVCRWLRQRRLRVRLHLGVQRRVHGDGELGQRIADSFGAPLGDVVRTNFSDGEFRVTIEETVRGKEVVIVQSTFAPADNLLELLLI